MTNLPSYVTFDEQTNEFSAFTENTKNVGNYFVSVRAYIEVNSKEDEQEKDIIVAQV